MIYCLRRVRFYHEELRQWLQSLQQIGFGLIVLFPMALPALVFLLLAGIWLLFYVATLLGIWLKPKLFLMFPFAVMVGFVLLWAIFA